MQRTRSAQRPIVKYAEKLGSETRVRRLTTKVAAFRRDQARPAGRSFVGAVPRGFSKKTGRGAGFLAPRSTIGRLCPVMTHVDVSTSPATAAVPTTFADISWFVRLRWGATAGQGVTIAVAAWVLGLDLPLAPLFAVVGVGALSNAVLAVRTRGGDRIPDSLLGAVMVFDVLLLTALLALSGGASNPFNFLYLVSITLAAVILPTRWSWGLVLLSVVAFGLLFAVPGADHTMAMSNPQEVAGEHIAHMAHDAHDAHAGHGGHAGHAPTRVSADTPVATSLMAWHLPGMWVAFAVAACFIVTFVQRVMRQLRGHEAELRASREATIRGEKLAALATLSAGAAHELATPLSTIAVVSKELERELKDEKADTAQSAVTIREQVERCRLILEQMSRDAGDNLGEDPKRTSFQRLADDAVRSLPKDVATRVRVEGPDFGLVAPPVATTRILAGLLDNACSAAPDGSIVTMRSGIDDDEVRIDVIDHGCGMDPDVLARATDPFFTTKPTGEGMGLGLFLARAVTEQLGGRIEFESEVGKGTRVTLVLTRDPISEASESKS
jgi:two-component system, sensor histidine kinase RegB